MENTLENVLTRGANTDSNTEEVSDLKAAIEQMFEEMERVNARIERNQTDVERLRAETRAMIAELRTAA